MHGTLPRFEGSSRVGLNLIARETEPSLMSRQNPIPHRPAARRPAGKGLDKGARLCRSSLSLLALVLAACSGGESAPSDEGEPSALPAQITSPQAQTVTLWDDYVGRFEATERVEIRPRVSGYLDRVHFEPGRSVAEGDLLVTIDPRPFQAEIARIEAEIDQARSRQGLADSRTRRAKVLMDARAGSREEYEQTLAEQQSAASEIAAAQARLRAAKLDLEFTRIRAPMDGRIGEDLVNAGNLVTAGETLLTTVVSIDPIYFRFTGSEKDFLNYSRLSQRGERESSRDTPNPVRIKLADQDDYAITGEMAFLDNAIDRGTATITARAVVDNGDGFLTPGMFGQLRLYGRDPFEALLIPEKLVQYDQSRPFVWVLDTDNAAQKRFLTPGRAVEDGMIIVEDGVSESDRLVASNVMALQPGAAVQPLPQDSGGTTDSAR